MAGGERTERWLLKEGRQSSFDALQGRTTTTCGCTVAVALKIILFVAIFVALLPGHAAAVQVTKTIHNRYIPLVGAGAQTNEDSSNVGGVLDTATALLLILVLLVAAAGVAARGASRSPVKRRSAG